MGCVNGLYNYDLYGRTLFIADDHVKQTVSTTTWICVGRHGTGRMCIRD